MEFKEVVRRRRMVRNFEDRPLPDEVVERILSNALHAPSAGFSQGWAFLLLTEPDDRQMLFEKAFPGPRPDGFRWDGMYNAPAIIACMSHMDAYLDRYAKPDKGWTDRDPARWPVPYWHIDTGMAAMLMLLTAVDEGLGALFFGIADQDGFRNAFGVPGAYDAIGAIAVGYRAPDEPSPSLRLGRRRIEEVVHHGRW